MTLAPLLVAAPAIQFHAFAAMSTFALGLVQFAAPKGTLAHRTPGWTWVALMSASAPYSSINRGCGNRGARSIS